MKTRHILVFLLLLAAGCAKQPQLENCNNSVTGHIPMVFRAETGEISKVLLSEVDNKTLSWQVDDKIKIFDGTSDNLAPFVSAASGPAVDFYGKVSNEEGPFYALYPYQEGARFALDAANDNAPTIYAEVPEIQYAVAGSVPSNAFVAAAKSSPDGTLHFRTMISFIRFTLNDDKAADINSITLSGNNTESVAGSIKITFDNNGSPVDTYTDAMLRTVTLVGNFINGEDYIFAVREQVFWKGVTLSILYNDGNRRYISSEYRPVDDSGSDILAKPSQVMNFRAINASDMKTETPPDRYAAYLHGYDLEIAGNKYNKGNVPEFQLCRSEEIASHLNSATNKIIFIDSQTPSNYPNTADAVAGPCKSSKQVTLKGEQVLLVGRYADKDNLFEPSNYLRIESGNFVMYDLDVDLKDQHTTLKHSSRYFMQQHSTSVSDLDKLHIERCRIRNIYGGLIQCNATDNCVKSIKLLNSDFEISKADTSETVTLLSLYSCRAPNKIDEFIFKHNVVAHNFTKGARQLTCRVFDIGVSLTSNDPKTQTAQNRGYANKTWNTSISFCNNTMLNVPTPVGYVRAYKVKNMKINKNICAVQDGYDGYSGYLIYLYDWDKSTDNVDIQEGGNLFYGLDDNPKNWNIANASSLWHPTKTLTPPWENNNPPRSKYPFQTINFDTFTFTPIDEYAEKDFGAKR